MDHCISLEIRSVHFCHFLDDEICMDDHAFETSWRRTRATRFLSSRRESKEERPAAVLVSGDIRIPRRYGDAQ